MCFILSILSITCFIDFTILQMFLTNPMCLCIILNIYGISNWAICYLLFTSKVRTLAIVSTQDSSLFLHFYSSHHFQCLEKSDVMHMI